jgi:hypothetical protein
LNLITPLHPDKYGQLSVPETLHRGGFRAVILRLHINGFVNQLRMLAGSAPAIRGVTARSFPATVIIKANTSD